MCLPLQGLKCLSRASRLSPLEPRVLSDADCQAQALAFQKKFLARVTKHDFSAEEPAPPPGSPLGQWAKGNVWLLARVSAWMLDASWSPETGHLPRGGPGCHREHSRGETEGPGLALPGPGLGTTLTTEALLTRHRTEEATVAGPALP